MPGFRSSIHNLSSTHTPPGPPHLDLFEAYAIKIILNYPTDAATSKDKTSQSSKIRFDFIEYLRAQRKSRRAKKGAWLVEVKDTL